MSFDASPIALAPPKLRVFTTKQRFETVRPRDRDAAGARHGAAGADAKPAGDGAHLEDRIEIGRARNPPCPVIDQLLNGDGREARIDGPASAARSRPSQEKT